MQYTSGIKNTTTYWLVCKYYRPVTSCIPREFRSTYRAMRKPELVETRHFLSRSSYKQMSAGDLTRPKWPKNPVEIPNKEASAPETMSSGQVRLNASALSERKRKRSGKDSSRLANKRRRNRVKDVHTELTDTRYTCQILEQSVHSLREENKYLQSLLKSNELGAQELENNTPDFSFIHSGSL